MGILITFRLEITSSSTIQILPSIQPIIRKVTTVIRTPAWISPPFGPDQDAYSKPVIQPSDLLNQRKSIENGINSLFPVIFVDSPL